MKSNHSYYIVPLLLLFLLGSCKKSPKAETTEASVQTKTEAEPHLLSTEGQEASSVYLTKDEKNNPLISWVEVDSVTREKAFYFARFEARKNQFGKATSIPIQQNASIHEEGMPKMAVKGDGSLFALYETSEEPKENERWGLGDVRYLQSFDKGKTWTKPRSVAPKDYEADQSSSFSGLSRLRDGEIGIAWLSTSADPSDTGRPVKFAKTHGKEGLTDPVLVDPHACECCRIAMDSYGDQGLIIAYRSLRGDNIRDIAVSQSIDNGSSFSDPYAFSGDHWEINGCPHNGPSIAAVNDHFYVTWFTGKEDKEGVHYAELDSEGKVQKRQKIDAYGQFIQVGVSTEGNRFLAYNHDYQNEDGKPESQIIVERIQEGKSFKKELVSPHREANYPMVGTSSDGNLVVAWSDKGQVYYTALSPKTIDGRDAADFLGYSE